MARVKRDRPDRERAGECPELAPPSAPLPHAPWKCGACSAALVAFTKLPVNEQAALPVSQHGR